MTPSKVQQHENHVIITALFPTNTDYAHRCIQKFNILNHASHI